ncbi:hypothetical protein R8789_45660 [Streptomyces malaysiensis]|nr:hypothetical protein R8789_45660 [Streptomyces malaysiensis]
MKLVDLGQHVEQRALADATGPVHAEHSQRGHRGAELCDLAVAAHETTQRLDLTRLPESETDADQGVELDSMRALLDG